MIFGLLVNFWMLQQPIPRLDGNLGR